MAGAGSSFATIEDVVALYRELSLEEERRSGALLPVISDRLRFEAKKAGSDLDLMIEKDPVIGNVAKSVTVDVLARTLMTPTAPNGMGPMTQMSQAAGGYSVSGSFLNPGGGLFIKDSELKALGLKRQKYGVMEIYADPWNPNNPI